MKHLRLLFLILISSLAVSPAVSQQASFGDHQYRSDRPVGIERVTGEILIDGRVDEAAWDDLTPIPWHVYDPSYGAPASQQTEFRVGYDDDYIYFSCRCYDSDPNNIAAISYKRDGWDANYDQVALSLDTFSDRENTLMFIVSAAGVRIDVAISNDAQGDAPFNLSWNTFWDAETSITEEGWFAELRVPLSSIRFNTVDGQTTMGMMVYRFLSQNNEMHIYPERPKDWGFFSFFKPSLAQQVTFEGIESERAFYVTPYLLAGRSRSVELNDDETDYEIDDVPTFDIGLDLKVGLTSNLTMDLTANTDFAQVEADDQQVNLTRFSLFFPERRLFFQERSTNFELNFGFVNRLFYTRQIGINDDELVTLLGGVRIVGRIGKWDIGALNMQSARNSRLPSENFGVLRLRRQVLNVNSYAGTILTTRVDEDGGYNVGLGFDGIFRLVGDDYLTLAAVHTFDHETENGFDATRLRLHLRREKLDGLRYELEFNRAGEDYQPDLGFEIREDYTEYRQVVGFGKVGVEGDRFKRLESSLYTDLFVTNGGGSLQTRETTAKLFLLGWTDASVDFRVTRWTENLDDVFELSDDIDIPQDRYTYHEAQVMFNTWQTRKASAITYVTVGQFFDGDRITLHASPKWNVSKVLELSGTYQYDHITFPDRDDSFNSHLLRLKVGLTFNREFSVSSFVQFNSDADIALGNFRIRYNPREGNDLYLVFNQALNTDRLAKTPIPPYMDSRALVLKYSYTFVR